MTDKPSVPSPKHSAEHTVSRGITWLPNALTLSRILTLPLLIFGIIGIDSHGADSIISPLLLIFLFILSALTDFLDGYLARLWHVTSDFGRMIDPIADKLFVAGCLIAFIAITKGNPWVLIPALVIIGRDIFISGLREHTALSGITLPPTQIAKAKTALEMLALLLLLLGVCAFAAPVSTGDLGAEGLSHHLWQGGLICLWLAAALSAYTGGYYLHASFRQKSSS